MKKDYIDYRDNFFVSVTDIGTPKMAYIGHRNSAFLYWSQALKILPYNPYIEHQISLIFLYLAKNKVITLF